MKINYCLHTHTSRCGHAIGRDEDYVENGIKFGLTFLGISDHVILPDISQPGMRGAWYLFDDYFTSLEKLSKKYKDQITILKGFECEYLSRFEGYYRDLFDTHKVDYLILGQHCYFEGDDPCWYMDLGREEALTKYTDDLIKGMSTGLFLYVAHPDLFMCFTDRWDELEIKCAKRIIDAAVKYNLPLEINLCHARAYGIRKFAGFESYYQYPFTPFWRLVAQSKAKVVVGFDSHDPRDVSRPGLEVIEYVVKHTGVKPIYNLSFKDNKIKI